MVEWSLLRLFGASRSEMEQLPKDMVVLVCQFLGGSDVFALLATCSRFLRCRPLLRSLVVRDQRPSHRGSELVRGMKSFSGIRWCYLVRVCYHLAHLWASPDRSL